MQDIRNNRVGNEFRSLRLREVVARAEEVAVQAVEAIEVRKEHLLQVGEQVFEAGEQVVKKLEPYLPEDPRRRTLLKYSLIGGAAFMIGKVLGPSFSLFAPGEVALEGGDKEYLFKIFRVVEKDGQLGFYDKLGNEILVLEKDELPDEV